MRSFTLIISICEKINELVLCSTPCYLSVSFFRRNGVATLETINDTNLEVASEVVTKCARK